jgi:hypothetical protein
MITFTKILFLCFVTLVLATPADQPYRKEHSWFFELTCFALSLDWARIVATVRERRERGKPRQNHRVDRAMGGGSQETSPDVDCTLLHIGISVITNFFLIFFTEGCASL